MEKLTEREFEILAFVSGGKDNDTIAEKLFISKHTVKAHIRSILRKINAKNRTHLVYIALKNGIVNLP